MSNFVRMFKPRFAALVEAGTKEQTVRPPPNRMPKAGDTISLRAWTGKPYRSKQRILKEAVIDNVKRITVCQDYLWHEINGATGVTVTSPSGLDEFAKADGFSSWAEMIAWFDAEHGLPFSGIVIYWRKHKHTEKT